MISDCYFGQHFSVWESKYRLSFYSHYIKHFRFVFLACVEYLPCLGISPLHLLSSYYFAEKLYPYLLLCLSPNGMFKRTCEEEFVKCAFLRFDAMQFNLI